MSRMYFIGVTTGASSIHNFFGRWAALAGVDDAVLTGIDIPLGASPDLYRDAVRAILDDPDACGALVTTHKTAVYEHTRDLFFAFDSDADALREVSCITRHESGLAGAAIDPLACSLALRAVFGDEPFRGDALILGAGGAAVALATALFREHRPAAVTLTEISHTRRDAVRALTPADCLLVMSPEDHDRLIARLPAGALVVNATGMGKDRPGVPITSGARFPAHSIAWDLNYRGDLHFLKYAKGAQTADGWELFLHGWSQIMSRVFGFALTPELFAAMRAVVK
jgi:shikimate dehydrogenase